MSFPSSMQTFMALPPAAATPPATLLPDAPVPGGRFPPVGLADHPDRRAERLSDGGRVVRRTVVDDEHLADRRRPVQDRRRRLPREAGPVVTREDDGDGRRLAHGA